MKLLYTSLLITLTLTARAESITSVMPCGDTKIVTEALRERYKEIPIIIGKADDEVSSVMSLWTNFKTGTWTLVATKEDLSCVIGTGKSLKVIDLGKSV